MRWLHGAAKIGSGHDKTTGPSRERGPSRGWSSGCGSVPHWQNQPARTRSARSPIRSAPRLDDGFASAWISNIFGLEALTALAVAGRQVPGIELGTAVVPTYPRHPAVLAQQALTTDVALGGRLVLGIGLSHQIVIQDMYGYSFDKPARHMREYLAVLVPLLAGEPADFDGETVHAHIGLSVPRSRPRVPLLLAALAPQMLRLAGTKADGTILWMTGPATVRDYIVPTITAAASEAGRPSPRVVCTSRCA